ncbi:MAG: hypothetical protein RLZ37_747, partial [Actinomycetota bacterium]
HRIRVSLSRLNRNLDVHDLDVHDLAVRDCR